MLTKKQNDLLRFINERVKEQGVPPSFTEMAKAMDLSSKSGIHRMITALEERGFIRRLPNRARALEVIRMPGAAPAAAVRFMPALIDGNLARAHASAPITIPVMGKIAAGTPISAIEARSHMMAIPPGFLGTGDHFALEVHGDSMIEAGILDTDTVIIRRQDIAETGDIVVAIIDDEEATLKRLRRRGASIALEAANPAYETRIFGPSRVRIVGKMVGLIRKY